MSPNTNIPNGGPSFKGHCSNSEELPSMKVAPYAAPAVNSHTPSNPRLNPINGGPSYKGQCISDEEMRVSAEAPQNVTPVGSSRNVGDSFLPVYKSLRSTLPIIFAEAVSDGVNGECMQESYVAPVLAPAGMTAQRYSTSTASGIRQAVQEKARRKEKIIVGAIVALVLVIIAVMVGVTVRNASNGGGADEPMLAVEAAPVEIFDQTAQNLDGETVNEYFGSALALSKTGDRLAVASSGAMVQVYEFARGSEWVQLGSDIEFEGIVRRTSEHKFQDHLTAIAMNSDGNSIAVGFSYAKNQTGQVQVFQYASGDWLLVAEALTGSHVGDRFGAAVAMNAIGNVIAVGAPGFRNAAGMVQAYQLDSNGSWGQRARIDGLNAMGRSVSLSDIGDRVAVASRSNPDSHDEPVVKVYSYNFGFAKWILIGDGVSAGTPSSATTGWYVELSGAGDRMVISNSYIFEADFVNTEANSLFVQAYQLVSGNWVPVGDNFHAGITGPKSGYFISLSDDGLTIAMGDPGTNSGGRSRGHAHVYHLAGDGTTWKQHGPNIEGDADGDIYGFAVTISGDGNRFAVGSPFNRAAASNAGRVQVFEVSPERSGVARSQPVVYAPVPVPVPTPVATIVPVASPFATSAPTTVPVTLETRSPLLFLTDAPASELLDGSGLFRDADSGVLRDCTWLASRLQDSKEQFGFFCEDSNPASSICRKTCRSFQ